MRKRWLFKFVTVIAVVTYIFLSLQVAKAQPKGYDVTVIPDDAEYAPGELLVRFAPGADKKQIDRSEKERILNVLGGGTVKKDFRIVPGLSVIKLPAELTVRETVKTFNKIPEIIYAEPNYKIYFDSTTPTDTYFSSLWGLHNTGQSGGTEGADIDAPEAWDIESDSSVIVAVIDTGIDYTHEDLNDNIWANPNETYNGNDDDGNGYVDDVHGWDFGDTNDNDPMDNSGHGTNVASVIGAVGNNGKGVVGVCWDIQIMPLKITDYDDPNAMVSNAIEAIEYADDKGAQIANCSWHHDGGYSQTLKETIEGADALFVISAGNGRRPNIDIYPKYPACYDCNNIVVVMATDRNDDKWGNSKYGPNTVDLGAPGVDIRVCENGGGYMYNSGTSFAAPHVAGACALVDIDTILKTVDKLPSLEGLCVTEGRLNLYRALTYDNDSTPVFKINNSSGQTVAWFGELGNLFLKGTLTEEATPEATANDEFLVKYQGDELAVVDTTTGDMEISGTLYDEQGTLTPSGAIDDFIIKNSSGDVIAYINQSGDLYLKGIVYENACFWVN